jgi:hypothetical protein
MGASFAAGLVGAAAIAAQDLTDPNSGPGWVTGATTPQKARPSLKQQLAQGTRTIAQAAQAAPEKPQGS